MGSKEKTEFASRMKSYEAQYETVLSPEKWTIIRLDGHGFSKFTRGFDKPFDSYLAEIMINTAQETMDEFNAVTAYVQSDEITIVLKPDPNLVYSGRVQKLTSLSASFATMKFNEFIRHKLETSGVDGEKRELLEKKVGKAFFDSRIFQVDTEVETFNAVLWRMKDCVRNSKMVYAQSILSHKECMNKKGDELVLACQERGHDWNIIQERYKYGTLIKKESFIKPVEFTEDGRMTLEGFCIRTRFKRMSIEPFFSEENVKLITASKIS